MNVCECIRGGALGRLREGVECGGRERGDEVELVEEGWNWWWEW